MSNPRNREPDWAQFEINLAKANSLNKALVFAALAEAGIIRLTASFDGEDDGGQITDTVAFNGDTFVDCPHGICTIYRARSDESELMRHDVTLREAVEELCYAYLEQEYPSWGHGEGAFGEFTFHVPDSRIALVFKARFTSYDEYNHVFWGSLKTNEAQHDKDTAH
jgi:hypothetical protein